MTEVQIWSLLVAALATAVFVLVIVLRRRQKRAHPHGHIIVDMTVPKAEETERVSNDVSNDPAAGGADIKQV